MLLERLGRFLGTLLGFGEIAPRGVEERAEADDRRRDADCLRRQDGSERPADAPEKPARAPEFLDRIARLARLLKRDGEGRLPGQKLRRHVLELEGQIAGGVLHRRADLPRRPVDRRPDLAEIVVNVVGGALDRKVGILHRPLQGGDVGRD
ncbi:hypothetical protein ATC00_02000 [Sinorhizobium americanum]|nr:hypothetical protein ATC00_02000 [Sinorhizobium americanum]